MKNIYGFRTIFGETESWGWGNTLESKRLYQNRDTT